MAAMRFLHKGFSCAASLVQVALDRTIHIKDVTDVKALGELDI